jgi:hypothetical protein
VTSGAIGTGNGTVTFNVSSNDGKKRTGSVTVAERNVKIEQDERRK